MGFFSHGKNKKKRVLSRQSLLSAMHIAEKNVYDSIHKVSFSHGICFPILQYGKKNPMGFFDFFTIAYF